MTESGASGAPSTPMFQQYLEVKRAHPDAIVLFRMGDFFEMFFDDAVLCSKALDIALTSRGPKGGPEPAVPMAGVPAHAVDSYVQRLVRLGHRVALADQVEDARFAKGLLRREVVRVATPGTTVDREAESSREHVFLMALVRRGDRLGLGFTDFSTGRFDVAEVAVEEAAARLTDEIARYRPREILLPAGSGLCELLPPDHGAALTERPAELASPERAAERLRRHLGTADLAGFGLEGRAAATAAAGLLYAYLEETQKARLDHFGAISLLDDSDSLVLDASTVRNLELVRSLQDGSTRATLLEAVDRTVTPMGARLLRERLLRPSRRVATICERLEAVAAWVEAGNVRTALREGPLARVLDLERLLSRVALGTANARDLLALAGSLRVLPAVRAAARERDAALVRRLADAVDPLEDVLALVDRAIAPDAPASLREGGLIRDGFDAKLDELKLTAREGRAWIAGFEARERAATGIASLKVRYNQVFGYSIEVTRANLAAVPAHYERRQTLANAERFTTAELKEWEARILEAETRLVDLEFERFVAVRERVAAEAPRIAATARAIAEIDLVVGWAEVAARGGFCCPEMAEDGALEIDQGRHPVVELHLGGERFVPNDLRLDPERRQIVIVTGPNMGGKSTWLRQAALTAVLAQAGSWVPAARARIPVFDRVFTRVGASDDLARGRSTFLVEMIETANILHNATDRSLVVLDEVGRGTATFDGLSLAWAIVEHLHALPRGRPLVLFATHYHELTDLAGLLPRVANVRVAVASHKGQVVFLRRIEEGRSDRSYGIEVARLAGLPASVVSRAREVLRDLEAVELGLEERLRPGGARPAAQLTLFVPAAHPVIEELKRIDPDRLTPLEALERLAELVRRARSEL